MKKQDAQEPFVSIQKSDHVVFAGDPNQKDITSTVSLDTISHQTFLLPVDVAICEKMADSKSSSNSPKPTNLKPWPPAGVKWYYSDESCAIALGDCRDILPSLPKVDLVLTDPPFGVGNFVQVTGRKRGLKVLWNESKPDDSIFELIKQKSTYRIIWGANYFNWFEPPNGCIVWIKNQTWDTASKAEIASVNFFKKTEIIEITWKGAISAVPKESEHPCERPISLYTWCINYAPPSETILDPFMGSGTTLRACKDLGRKGIGIEIEEKYCEIAVRRLHQEVLDFDTAT